MSLECPREYISGPHGHVWQSTCLTEVSGMVTVMKIVSLRHECFTTVQINVQGIPN
jgi:hypothetical protein